MYTRINKIKQFDFQINRVLTYGDAACCISDIKKNLAHVSTFDEWYETWTKMAEDAVKNQKWMHAAYYDRMAEFFLKSGDKKKEAAYKKCLEEFYKGFAQLSLDFEQIKIPFENGYMKCIRMKPQNPQKTILVCGGYDSFIEEFVLQVKTFADKGYDVVLFEGPGQGECINQKMYFRYDFEVPVRAVLDFLKIEECGIIGISWGGYFSVRASAFEKRIKWTAAYDICDDGYELMTNIFPFPLKNLVKHLYKHEKKELLDKLCSKISKKSVLADWMFSQGKYITGTNSVYDMYSSFKKHNLYDCGTKVTQDILLLAGENDHYIPRKQFSRSIKRYTNAKSVSYRLFTKKEGGDQHCQIGNHQLALDEMLNFFSHLY